MWLKMKQACELTGKTRFTILDHVKAGHFLTKEPPHQGKEMLIDQDSIIAHYLPGLKPHKKKA